MNKDYEAFNPASYLSQLTQSTWGTPSDKKRELLTVLVDKRAQEVLKILKSHGIKAEKTRSKGQTRLTISHSQVEQLHKSVAGGPDASHLVKESLQAVKAEREEHATKLFKELAKPLPDAEKVRGLILKGADLNRSNNQGLTPLHIATRNGQLDLVKLLLEAGADPNKAKKTGETPLYTAVVKGHAEIAKALGARTENINQADAKGYKRDNPQAQVHFLDTGHFALETHAPEIATHIRRFMR